jgi:PKD repeat protein
MTKMRYASQFAFLLSMAFLTDSCKDDGFPVPPASTVPLFSYTIDNDGFAPCTVTFKNESIVPEESGTPTYSWKFGDGSSSSEVSPIHLYLTSGAFDVKLTIKTSISIEIVELTKSISIKNANASGVPVYFTNGSQVFTGLVNEDKPLFSPLNISPLKDGYGIIIDTVQLKLYISDLDGNSISKCDLDGKNMVDFRTGLDGPVGMAIDYEGNMIYWTTGAGIQRADLSDTDVNQKEDFVTGKASDDPDGIAIDPVNKKLYWSTYNDAGVWVKNLDGTGESVLLPGVGGGSIIVVGNRIIYDHWIATGDIHIKSANLDGTDVKTLATAVSRLVYGLAYEPDGTKVYWGDRTPGKIMRANLDGSGVEAWYTSEGSSPRGIAFGKKK